MEMRLLVGIFLFCAVKVAAPTQYLYPVNPKTTVTYGANVQINFLSNFSDPRIRTFYMTAEGETIVSGTVGSIAADPNNKVFGNRLRALKYPNTNEYRLFISEASYEDNVVIQIFTLIDEGTDPANPDIKAVRSNTTLEVLGGPGSCKNSVNGPSIGELPPETDVHVNSSHLTHIEMFICGSPKPQVTWTLGDEILTNVISELVVKDPTQGTTYKGRYRSRVQLPMVTPSMCGKNLRFSSQGYNREATTGGTILNVKFTPSTVIKTSYRINSSCVHVEWEPIDIGLCSGLEYEIRFSNKTGSPIVNSTFPHPNTRHVACFGDVIGENSTLVQVQVHFDRVAGGWSGSKFVLLENPEPKPTAETDKSTQGDGVHKDWEAIVGGVVGGFLLILLIVLIIYCCCCGCWAGWCAAVCADSPCCKKEEKEEKYGVENSHSLSYQHKKNSKKKTRNIKVDLKNDTYSNSEMNNTFAPVVIADEKPYVIKSDTEKPPKTIYAQVQKPSPALSKSEASSNMKYFDPGEFDVESTPPPTTLNSMYTNSTYDHDEDEDIDNKPSFLI